MKRYKKLHILLAFFTLIFLVSPASSAQSRDELLNRCVQAMSRYQFLLEWYALTFGTYPSDEELSRLTQSPIVEPATGAIYSYRRAPDGSSYSLDCPNPKAHNIEKLTLTSLKGLPTQQPERPAPKGSPKRGQEKLTPPDTNRSHACAVEMKRAAFAVISWLTRHKGELPPSLDGIKEVPREPATGESYRIERLPGPGNVFEIVCPHPESHDKKDYRFNVKLGIIKIE
ncbi:MAG: hypothetical protein HYU64_01795 [Armatimonadetes bacterium]|nr:hypothetical protein [Armatimonadota bacterium]